METTPLTLASGDVRQRKAQQTKTESVGRREVKTRIERDKEDRENCVLWKKPIPTMINFALELMEIVCSVIKRIYIARNSCLLALGSIGLLYGLYQLDGPHSRFIRESEDELLWGLYWVWLGILSSVGLGTGLHTFLLFLGPFIAKVTLAAYECDSTNFPKPPYPDELICPEDDDGSGPMSMWLIMSRVRFPAFCWGAGTALGELPPYFMARAARLTGCQDEDDEEMAEFQELLDAQANGSLSATDLTYLTRAKLLMHNVIQRVGFFGILAAASIPNPLFDLAGITCGHFLIPFWTFFGATLIGKAIIKMHIQKIFIIFIFSKHHVNNLLSVLQSIPLLGSLLYSPLEKLFENERKKLHEGKKSESDGSIVGQFFEMFILLMVGYFVVTIINSLAQLRIGRKQKEERDLKFDLGKKR